MPYIPLEEHLPGITGLLEYRRDTAEPIRNLTQILLRGHNTLTEFERELIATLVSSRNQCKFCTTAHAVTAEKLSNEQPLVAQVIDNYQTAEISPRLKALLHIAAQVQQNGKAVTAKDVEAAQEQGATDGEIHDTVLIAALFCMYNRYVDGLATALPGNPAYFNQLADRLVNHGYTRLPQGYDHLKQNNT